VRFKLHSDYQPSGDQPEAIRQLVRGLEQGVKYQTLLGVTGSGKTFTMANVIEQAQRPVLILSHNKTLAAQLYSEFKSFFPENLVEYFVSYYDYYQPEAFIPTSNLYIEKDLSINDEIEKLRLATSSALLSGRSDVVVVASISCIYGIGNPSEFHALSIELKVGDNIGRQRLLHRLVEGLYFRAFESFERGSFRVKGDTVDVFLAYAEHAIRVVFWGDEIEAIQHIDPETGEIKHKLDRYVLYPANLFVSSKETMAQAVWEIQQDMKARVDEFVKQGKKLEAQRLQERVEYDLEMIKELGYCSGIENYSRYFDRRQQGQRPFCLVDYFPKDYILMVDESHVTIPQIGAMSGGDRSRKINLVDYGFRLPSALDNRPLRFDEFEEMWNQVVFVSATPADFELIKSEGVVVEQVVRPTGLLDPPIEVRPSINQINDLLEEIDATVGKGQRVLVTTLTKRMAEELVKYLERLNIQSQYIHSDVDTLDRIEILRKLREGVFDVLVGVNLLREGLDLPEVSLVAILDADKEGFLRSHRSLTQTAGRAARNVNGRVIMYADKITDSMQRTIDETNRRRSKQMEYNERMGITPKQIVKAIAEVPGRMRNLAAEPETFTSEAMASEPVVQYMSKEQLEKTIRHTKALMEEAAKETDFMEAARYRDEWLALKKILEEKFGEVT
jgi:excinuclease ABC subunit B